MLRHLNNHDFKKLHMLVPPSISSEVFKNWGSCQAHAGRYRFSKILSFVAKFKLYIAEK